MGYLNPQTRIIMVAPASGRPILLVHSKFGGRTARWLKSTKVVSRPNFYWLRYICTRDSSLLIHGLVSSFDLCQSAPLVFAFLGRRTISVKEASVLGTPAEGRKLTNLNEFKHHKQVRLSS